MAVAGKTGLSSGTTVAAVDGGAISILRGGRIGHVSPPEHGPGVIRHVSVAAGVGTAYVRDRDGHDLVVSDTRAGVRRFRAHGEALNPSLSADGQLVWAQAGGLRLVGSGSASVRRIAGPMRRDTAFSPVFRDDETIVAAIASPPVAAVPEDEYLSNLWRYHAGAGWTELTHFSGGADRWTVVRTPFRAPDGSIEFVVVHGRASLDRPPAFALWRLTRSIATRVRSLPGEMYLAGYDGSARLWNLRDGLTGAWEIDREGADASLERVACGAVAVDPLDRPDPDRRWSMRSTETDPSQSSAPDVDQILVGDFSSSDAAGEAAGRITSAFGASATVVDSSSAPAVVRPGVWAVVVGVTSDDPEGDLARFRQALPEFADWSWIVSI